MSKPDGGPAFPVPADHIGPSGEVCTTNAFGMTLRDYFAAKALQGMGANPETAKRMLDQFSESVELDNAVARQCYRMADAMLKAREQ